MAIAAEWKACAEASEAKVTELKALLTARVMHMQEEITWALTSKSEIWQRDGEIRATMMESTIIKRSFRSSTKPLSLDSTIPINELTTETFYRFRTFEFFNI